jgi:DNA replication and repair protein RecF
MYLTNLSITQFKNITEAELDFSPALNCFVGNNGAGKTTILDAIHYLALCKSHIHSIDSQNIQHEADFFILQATCQNDHHTNDIYCGVQRHRKKMFKYNGREYDRLSEHIGRLPLVMISPSDEALILDGSDERRRFMDMVISQYDQAYMEALVTYNKALQQRNILLKEEAPVDDSLFEVYEYRMEESAKIVNQKRASFTASFCPVFEQFYQAISEGRESIQLSYVSHASEGSLADQLRQSRQKDTWLGYTSRGIHKDELLMELNGYPIKQVGSQGQNKSYLIALKLGEFDFLKKHTGMTPLLLIDDLFDKLDDHRVQRIIQLVSGEAFGQIFITDTHAKHLDQLLQHTGGDYRIFYVADGVIQNEQL